MTHYLDYAATAPVLPQSAQAIQDALGGFYNPSSQYPPAKEVAGLLADCRRTMAAALGCQMEEVFFTSGGTEGDNWALGWARQRKKGHIITTAVEHPAVLEPVKALAQQGFAVTYLPVDRAGHVSVGDFEKALREDTVLCSMMLVNNELGAVQPVAECRAIAKGYNKDIFFHTDAVQGFLKLPFTCRELGVDALTVSGHKIGAPKGIGAVYLKAGGKLKPMLLGGGQESGMRAGTEPTVLIAALAAAARQGMEGQREELERLAKLQDYAVRTLKEAVPELELISRGDVPHILAVTLPGYRSEVLVRFLGDRGVCVSSGSACHKGKPSHVYAALGLPKPWLAGALRISLGGGSTEEDIDALAQGLKDARAVLFTSMS